MYTNKGGRGKEKRGGRGFSLTEAADRAGRAVTADVTVEAALVAALGLAGLRAVLVILADGLE